METLIPYYSYQLLICLKYEKPLDTNSLSLVIYQIQNQQFMLEEFYARRTVHISDRVRVALDKCQIDTMDRR